MLKLYDELAEWWPLLSAPADYADEAAFFLSLFAEVNTNRPASFLELGSGGGNNALHMKSAFANVTLVDLSPKMLEVSHKLNPDCEHLQGDMTSVRLGRTFDAVFIHDAIDYMIDHFQLKQAMETAYIHCKSGGMAVLAPDGVRETFAPSTEHGGEDGEGRSLRYLEWSYDPDPADSTYFTDYVVICREDHQAAKILHDRHLLGIFARDEWLNLLIEVGFRADFVLDHYDRHIFIGHKP